jgi:hypothetical protein
MISRRTQVNDEGRFQRSFNETLLPKAMQRQPSWEVNTLSATQQILNLWDPEFSFPSWQKLAVWPYSDPDIASPLSPTYSLKIDFNNIFRLRLGLPRYLFSYSIPKKKILRVSDLSYALLLLSILIIFVQM